MYKRIIFLLFLFYGMVFGGDTNNAKNINNPYPEPVTIKQGFKAPADKNDTAKWNMTNWKNYFSEKGTDTSLIGNTQAMMENGKESKTAFSGNPNLLTSDAIRTDSNLSKNIANKSWSKSLEEDVIKNSVGNPYISTAKTGDTIQCYITRDIPFRWKCKWTGLIYGGAVNENGKKARLECDNECYEQKTCINLNPNSTANTKTIEGFSCEFPKDDNNCTVTSNLEKNRNIKTIEVEFPDYNETSEDFYINITLERNKMKDRQITKNLRRVYLNNNRLLVNVDEFGDKLKMAIKPIKKDDDNTTIYVNKIKINYRKNDKFICRSMQDINLISPGKFGYSCASGNVETFSVGGKTYKICNDGNMGADNSDGTFSDEQSCLSACKIARRCVSDQTTFTSEALKTFREGCIQGQANCSDKNKDCKFARLHGDKVLNEVVFNATEQKRTTVKNSVQVRGVERPRIDPGEDLDFKRRNQEEWKDKAFQDMALNHKYSNVRFSIGEESNASSSYRIGYDSGASYGKVGTSRRSLYWNLKPKTFDVNNDKTYYLYAVIVADFGYHEYNSYGELEKKQKEIWYIKQTENDNFKAIRRAMDVGYASLDDANKTVALKIASSDLENETFIGNSWMGLNINQKAEYFKALKFENNKMPFWSFPIMSNIGNLIYALPGIVRSVKRVAASYDIYKYNGNFDGTGDGMLTFSIITYYSDTPLTYAQLYQKIADKEAKKIYKEGEEYLYKIKLPNDGVVENKNIEIYQYGPPSRTDLSTRIFPKKTDIGKKGFIYVFIQ